MAGVRWTSQALDDLEAICLFIARDAPHVAAIFADRALIAKEFLVRKRSVTLRLNTLAMVMGLLYLPVWVVSMFIPLVGMARIG